MLLKLVYSYVIVAFLFIGPASAFTQDVIISFKSNRQTVFRSTNLGSPQVLPVGSEVQIDPAFLQKHLGSPTPQQDDFMRLLLNPGEVSNGSIVTRSVTNFYNGKTINDYFFPVLVKTKDGKVIEGQMAVQAFHRLGALEIQRSDGANPNEFLSQTVAQRVQDQLELNKSEGNSIDCNGACLQPNSAASLKKLETQIKDIQTSIQQSQNPLWEKYKLFAADFHKKNRISQLNVNLAKRLYIKKMIETLGAKDAGQILSALTAFGEAPHRDNETTQIAELAIVMKIINNRAESNFRKHSKTLRDLNVSPTLDSTLTNVLSDRQFSVWDEGDSMLPQLLRFNPEKTDFLSMRKMNLAFEAQHLMNQSKVEFQADLNRPDLRHYHASYVTPYWANSQKRAKSAIVKVNDNLVDLTKQRGSRHIFYSGVM